MSDTRKQVSSSTPKMFCISTNVILSSCLTFDDGVYYRTSDNTFIPISNSEKPVAGNKCYVQTKDIIIHLLTEYLTNDINQCGTTCNIFINDQSFKSNLTGKEYKTISPIQTGLFWNHMGGTLCPPLFLLYLLSNYH